MRAGGREAFKLVAGLAERSFVPDRDGMRHAFSSTSPATISAWSCVFCSVTARQGSS